MSELQQARDASPQAPTPAALTPVEIFAPKPPESGGTPVLAWVIAGLVVLLVLGGILIATHKKSSSPGNTVQPLAGYATSLPISQLAMSESANISGGKYTYIDGHIKNTGNQTVTGITVQVLFANDMELAPQVNTIPLFFIRTREPYIDIQPISANPLKPGDDRELRLTFETIPDNWNTQMPEVRVIAVEAK